jgi:hypothetical protein
MRERQLKRTIIIAACLVLATPSPAKAHEVPDYYSNPIQTWVCGETEIEMNKQASDTYDLVFTWHPKYFPKRGIHFKLTARAKGKVAILPKVTPPSIRHGLI